MDYLEAILAPLILVMRLVLQLFHDASSNYGIAIVGLSIVSSVIMLPVVRAARRLEVRSNQLQSEMAPLLEDIQARYAGRERFERIEQLYRTHNYHPIKSMTSLLPLMVQLPFVIAASLLLKDYAPLDGESFLMIGDLSEQDQLVPVRVAGVEASLNLLPMLVIGVALVDSRVRRESTPSSRRKFALVSAVMALLIYRMPSAVCLYWLIANVWSILGSLVRRLSPQATHQA